MGIFRKKPQPASSIQAATVLTDGNPTSPKNILMKQSAWQRRINAMANAIPEVSAAGSYVHNVMNRVEFKVESETLSPAILKTLNDGLASFRAGRAAENIFFTGEVAVGYKLNQDTNRFEWSDYSAAEVAIKSGRVMVKTNDGNLIDDEELNLFQIIQRDKTNKSEPYSPHRSMLEMLEAWLNHQSLDNRIAQNRLSLSGMITLPREDFPNIPHGPDGKAVAGSQQEFQEQFGAALGANLAGTDPDAAAIPYVLFLSAEHAGAFSHLLLSRNDDAGAFRERMDGYAERYARGVDLPVEIVLGSTDANHWTAWKIDEDNWKYYLAPKAELIADAILYNYAIPLAERLSGGRVAGLEVVPDPSIIVTKPDRTEAAIKLREIGVITKEAAALASGFDITDIEATDLGIQQSSSPGLSVDANRGAPITAAAKPSSQKKTLDLISRDIKTINQELAAALKLTLDKYDKKYRAKYKTITAASLNDLNDLLSIDISKLIIKAVTARAKAIARRLGVSSFDAELFVGQTAENRAVAAANAAVQMLNQAGLSNRPVNTALTGQLISMSHGGVDAIDPKTLASNVFPNTSGDDQLITQQLSDSDILFSSQYTWSHGDPANPFEPHVELDGETWVSDDERNTIGSDAAFSPTGLWFPGDHAGCTCEIEVEFVPV